MLDVITRRPGGVRRSGRYRRHRGGEEAATAGVLAQVRGQDLRGGARSRAGPQRSTINGQGREAALRILILSSTANSRMRARREGEHKQPTKERRGRTVLRFRRIADGGGSVSAETAERLVLESAPRAGAAPQPCLAGSSRFPVVAAGQSVRKSRGHALSVSRSASTRPHHDQITSQPADSSATHKIN